jgi:starch phosphorylase
MFQNKLDFKQTFERRLSEKYGRTVADSHITERYDILGEMVRDYAGYNWRNCRERHHGQWRPSAASISRWSS